MGILNGLRGDHSFSVSRIVTRERGEGAYFLGHYSSISEWVGEESLETLNDGERFREGGIWMREKEERGGI